MREEVLGFVKPVDVDFSPLPKSDETNFMWEKTKMNITGKSTFRTCVHIRRGDFVDGQHHASNEQFVRAAVQFIRNNGELIPKNVRNGLFQKNRNPKKISNSWQSSWVTMPTSKRKSFRMQQSEHGKEQKSLIRYAIPKFSRTLLAPDRSVRLGQHSSERSGICEISLRCGTRHSPFVDFRMVDRVSFEGTNRLLSGHQKHERRELCESFTTGDHQNFWMFRRKELWNQKTSSRRGGRL